MMYCYDFYRWAICLIIILFGFFSLENRHITCDVQVFVAGHSENVNA